MANIKEADIQIFSDHLELFIESSKTDQYRDGAWIIIARSKQNTCPVGMLEWYMQLGNIGNSPELPLFRGIVHTRSGEQLRKKVARHQIIGAFGCMFDMRHCTRILGRSIEITTLLLLL